MFRLLSLIVISFSLFTLSLRHDILLRCYIDDIYARLGIIIIEHSQHYCINIFFSLWASFIITLFFIYITPLRHCRHYVYYFFSFHAELFHYFIFFITLLLSVFSPLFTLDAISFLSHFSYYFHFRFDADCHDAAAFDATICYFRCRCRRCCRAIIFRWYFDAYWCWLFLLSLFSRHWYLLDWLFSLYFRHCCFIIICWCWWLPMRCRWAAAAAMPPRCHGYWLAVQLMLMLLCIICRRHYFLCVIMPCWYYLLLLLLLLLFTIVADYFIYFSLLFLLMPPYAMLMPLRLLLLLIFSPLFRDTRCCLIISPLFRWLLPYYFSSHFRCWYADAFRRYTFLDITPLLIYFINSFFFSRFIIITPALLFADDADAFDARRHFRHAFADFHYLLRCRCRHAIIFHYYAIC